MLDSLRRDLRHALAALRKAPGVACIAILTIGLATGANTAMFSIVDTLLIRTLPYPAADRLVALFESSPTLARLASVVPVNADHFEEWRRNSRSFDALALAGTTTVNLTGAGDPQRLTLARVTPDLFRIFGATAQLGRLLDPAEDQPGHDHVVVLGAPLWRTRFGTDPSIVGRTVAIDGQPYEVVGVLADSFRFPSLASLSAMANRPDEPQVWKPFGLTAAERSAFGDFNYVAIGRLRAGVSPQQAERDLDAVQAAYAQRALGGQVQLHAPVVPLQQQLAGRSRDGLRLAMAAVLAVLLIAYTNVANLLLARSSARAHEFSVRAALGASRWHLARQTLFEALLLAGGGSIVGIALATAGVRLVVRFAPPALPYRDGFAVDLRVLVFTMATALLAGLVTGAWSAWRLARADARLAIASTRATADAGLVRTRTAFAVAEVAATAACLATAGLLLHSWLAVVSVDKGFNTGNIGTIDLTLPAARYAEPAQGAQFVQSLLETIGQVPGVANAAISNLIPLTGEGANNAVFVDGAMPDRLNVPIADIRNVSAGFFETMGIPLRDGRLFTPADGRRLVATISAAAAARLWPGTTPVGQQFRIGLPDSRFLVEVVGVVGDVRSASLEQAPALTIYLPYWQWPVRRNRLALAVRTEGSPRQVEQAIAAAVHRLDPLIGVPAMRTMDDVMAESVSLRTFQATLVAAFGGAALLLAGLGIYGVLAYAVSRRTREIGIRMALGARPRAVLLLVGRQAAGLLGVGLGLGLPLAVTTGAALRSLLFGVAPQDAAALGGAALLVALATLTATLAPAMRAARVDPVIALHQE
jgi:putative ABC transport system permease protein